MLLKNKVILSVISPYRKQPMKKHIDKAIEFYFYFSVSCFLLFIFFLLIWFPGVWF